MDGGKEPTYYEPQSGNKIEYYPDLYKFEEGCKPLIERMEAKVELVFSIIHRTLRTRENV